jgi:hypothetical protein
LTIPRSAQKLRAFIQEVQPDIVHAMRVPYEGMLTAKPIKNWSRYETTISRFHLGQ